MPREFTTAFLSATWTDLKDYREAVSKAVMQSDLHPLSMPFPATSLPPLDMCFRKIDQADLYVGIIGSRYGSRPSNSEKSFTQHEYEYAKHKGIPTLIFLMSKECQLRCPDADRGKDAERLEQFEELLREQNGCSSFDSPDSLATGVLASILSTLGSSRATSANHEQRYGLDAVLATCRDFSTSLLDWPKNLISGAWIERPELRALQDRVSSRDDSMTVLLGLPGCGKSALLARMVEHASQTGLACLAIKADQLPVEIANSRDLAEAIGLPERVEKCIAAASQTRPFLLVVDQLDALSDLSDLRSGRLNVILNLIRSCRDFHGVHIACSCREFEFRHDVRLNSLNAETIELQLPSWERVQTELTREGITGAAQWPEKFRAILQTPQHLDVFLRCHRETRQANVFTSYQQMLDDLWERKLREKGKLNVVYELAEILTKQEELWCPVVKFEDRQPLIDAIVADGIFVRHKLQIGFRHQTMLEHARARLFTKSDRSLATHVVARQDALFVRPMVWSTLAYLREADRAKYRIELEGLFGAGLRLHMRYLLIEFLGQTEEPEELECRLMARSLLSVHDRTRVLLAIRGKSVWFSKLREQFPMVMKWPDDQLWPMVGIVVAAWTFARAECFSLLDNYFLPDPQKDGWTYRCLSELREWDDAAVERACVVIGRTGRGRTWWVEDLVYVISKEAPELAAHAARRAFTHELEQLTNEDRSPLEDGREWHRLPEVAAAAPGPFLREMWSWFVDVVKRYHNGRASSVINEFPGFAMALEGAPEEVIHYPVAHAIETAVLMTAKNDPQTFLAATRSSWKVPLGPIQTLIARGFIEAQGALAKEALDFLSSDPRRFHLSALHRGDQFYSREVIAAIAPYVGQSGVRRLVRVIMRWSQYRDSSGLEEPQCVWDREARLRLLASIPTDLLPKATAQFVVAEKAILPDWNRGVPLGRWGPVHEIAPMDKDEMPDATDEAIIDTLQAPSSDDYGEWSESEGAWNRAGGGLAAVRELCEFAKQQPQRCLAMLPRIMQSDDEAAAARVLDAIATTDLPDDQLFAVILDLSRRATSEDYRSRVAHALYGRCRPQVGLSQPLCDLLERWLAMPWDAVEDNLRSRDKDEEEEREPLSLLWGYSNGTMNIDGSFWVLAAATRGYLTREPPDTGRWLGMLEDHLQRAGSEETWKAFAPELRSLATKRCNRRRVVEFVSTFFAKYPRLRESLEGVRLLAWLQRVLSRRVFEEIVSPMRLGDHRKGRQAYGELLAFTALRHHGPQWALRKLQGELRECDSRGDKVREDVLAGIGFVAGRFWDEPEVRAECGRILAKVFPVATERISSACSTVFWATQDFPPDEITESVLRAVANNTATLSEEAVSDLMGHLASLVPDRRQIVLKLCRSLVSHVGIKLTSISTRVFTCGPMFVNIAMTLQRFDDTRNEAMDLIEDLLRLGLDDAFNSLNEIDLRPASAARREVFPRRRRHAS